MSTRGVPCEAAADDGPEPAIAVQFARFVDALPPQDAAAYEREVQEIRARFDLHVQAGGDPDDFDPSR